VDGAPVRTVAELQARIARLQPGDETTLGVIRYGTPMERTVQLAEFEPVRVAVSAPPSRQGKDLLGFTYEAISQLRAGPFADGGVQITSVDPFGPLPENNLIVRGPGRVRVVSVNGQPVRTTEDLDRVASDLEPGALISLVVMAADQDAPQIYNYWAR
jgi:S1-C subfamily serine protease